jgi:hypothetical protein
VNSVKFERPWALSLTSAKICVLRPIFLRSSSVTWPRMIPPPSSAESAASTATATAHLLGDLRAGERSVLLQQRENLAVVAIQLAVHKKPQLPILRIKRFDQSPITPILAKKCPAPNVKISPVILETRHAAPRSREHPTNPRRCLERQQRHCLAHYQMLAEAEPDLLVRVLNLFALQFLTPNRSTCSGGRLLSIDIVMGGLSWHRAQVIAEKLA